MYNIIEISEDEKKDVEYLVANNECAGCASEENKTGEKVYFCCRVDEDGNKSHVLKCKVCDGEYIVSE